MHTHIYIYSAVGASLSESDDFVLFDSTETRIS